MNHSAWVDPRLRLVRVEGVRSYLLGQGWELQPYPGTELLVFGGPTDDDGEPIIEVLPSSERMRDFRLRVEELIAALSVIENRPAVDILNDILQAAEQPLPATQQEGTNGPMK